MGSGRPEALFLSSSTRMGPGALEGRVRRLWGLVMVEGRRWDGQCV